MLTSMYANLIEYNFILIHSTSSSADENQSGNTGLTIIISGNIVNLDLKSRGFIGGVYK